MPAGAGRQHSRPSMGWREALHAHQAIDDLLVRGVDRGQPDASHTAVVLLLYGQHLAIEVPRVVTELWIREPQPYVGERPQGCVQAHFEVFSGVVTRQNF